MISVLVLDIQLQFKMQPAILLQSFKTKYLSAKAFIFQETLWEDFSINLILRFCSWDSYLLIYFFFPDNIIFFWCVLLWWSIAWQCSKPGEGLEQSGLGGGIPVVAGGFGSGWSWRSIPAPYHSVIPWTQHMSYPYFRVKPTAHQNAQLKMSQDLK